MPCSSSIMIRAFLFPATSLRGRPNGDVHTSSMLERREILKLTEATVDARRGFPLPTYAPLRSSPAKQVQIPRESGRATARDLNCCAVLQMRLWHTPPAGHQPNATKFIKSATKHLQMARHNNIQVIVPKWLPKTAWRTNLRPNHSDGVSIREVGSEAADPFPWSCAHFHGRRREPSL